MASPRRTLLDAIAACLGRISRADGYETDAGQVVTLEPNQVDEGEEAVLGVVIAKQERATDVGIAKTHRLTTVAVLAKVPAEYEQAQARLDAIVGDVERAMADQQFRYPVGIQFPQYVSMEPAQAQAGMGWIGALLTYQSNIPIK